MFKFLRKNKRQPPLTLAEYIQNFGGYENNSERFLKELYKNPFTSSAMTRISEALQNLEWGSYKKGRNDNVNEVKDSFVSRTLAKPNPLLNIDQFISYFALYYIIFGELLVMRIDLYSKADLILFKKGSYTIEYDQNNILNGIKSIWVNMKQYKGDELKQFYYIKGINIYDSIAGVGHGISKVQSLSLLHDYYCYINNWNNNILKNGGKREIIALFKDFLNVQKRKEIETHISEHSGAKNIGKPLILAGENVEIKNGDFSPKEFDFLQAMDEIRNITAAVMNVPSILIGDRTNSKFSNYKEAKQDLYTENIIPLATQIAEYLTNILSDKLEKGEYIDLDTSKVEVLKKNKTEIMNLLNGLSYLTINEKRAELEYPAVDGGDELLVNVGVAPLGIVLNPTEPVEEDEDNVEEANE